MFLLRKPSVLFAFLEMRVMAGMSKLLKTTIVEHVSNSVKSMSNSVADIITESLNDRMTALETGITDYLFIASTRENEDT